MSQIDEQECRELAIIVYDELGEGVFTKPTIISAIGKSPSQHWWVRIRRGFALEGLSLREIEAGSGQWEIMASTGFQGDGKAGMLEEAHDLHEMWHKNMSGDVQALLGNVPDAEETMLIAVDRGKDPYRLYYLAAANGASEDQLEAMAGILTEVKEHVPGQLIERHEKIMGYLEEKTG